MEGTAHAAELQVIENLHAQFALGLQDLPFSEQHYIKQHTMDSLLHAPLTDHQHWLAHIALACQIGEQQHQAAGIQEMQAGFQDFLHPPPPAPHPPLRVELHLGSSLFFCPTETGELLLTPVSGP